MSRSVSASDTVLAIAGLRDRHVLEIRAERHPSSFSPRHMRPGPKPTFFQTFLKPSLQSIVKSLILPCRLQLRSPYSFFRAHRYSILPEVAEERTLPMTVERSAISCSRTPEFSHLLYSPTYIVILRLGIRRKTSISLMEELVSFNRAKTVTLLRSFLGGAITHRIPRLTVP